MFYKVAIALTLLATASVAGQSQPPAAAPPVEKLGENLFRIGELRVDRAAREVLATGVLNDITTVEFVASTTDGVKGYESAIALDTDAITLNAALLLIGLDPARSKPAKVQFDSTPPEGDPVELFVELPAAGKPRRVRVEDILFDQGTKKTLKPGPWVYSGSTFIETDSGRRFMAEVDGILVGLMRGPSALIDNPRSDMLGRFGAIILNPAIARPGLKVSLIVRALPRR